MAAATQIPAIGGMSAGVLMVSIGSELGLHTIPGEVLTYAASPIGVGSAIALWVLQSKLPGVVKRSNLRRAQKAMEKQLKRPDLPPDTRREFEEALNASRMAQLGEIQQRLRLAEETE